MFTPVDKELCRVKSRNPARCRCKVGFGKQQQLLQWLRIAKYHSQISQLRFQAVERICSRVRGLFSQIPNSSRGCIFLLPFVMTGCRLTGGSVMFMLLILRDLSNSRTCWASCAPVVSIVMVMRIIFYANYTYLDGFSKCRIWLCFSCCCPRSLLPNNNAETFPKVFG